MTHGRLLIIGMTIGVFSGFAQRSAQAPLVPPNGGKVTVNIEPRAQPRSLIQLIRMSNLIIDGTVTGATPPVNGSPNHRTPTIETDSIVTVNAVLKGTVPRSSASILIEQVGGKMDQWEITANGDPLLAVRERYIFFLQLDDRPDQASSSGIPRYGVTGVWSGKVKVLGEKVSFLPQADAELHTYDGGDVNGFLQLLSDTISHPYTDTHLPIQPHVKQKQP